MRKIVLWASLLASLSTLFACSHSVDEEQVKLSEAQRQVQRVTIVSSGEPAQVLPAFNSFTWNDDFNKVLSAIDASGENEMKSYIRAQLIQYLATKGYVYQADPMQADVVIGFLFALETDVADELIQLRFGLLPGLNVDGIDDPRYEKGSLLLSVMSADLSAVYWRSALQGLVDLEKGINDPGNDRMQSILSMMMGRFPQAGR